ncbi:MAG: restriction endonuclease subunit S, partial [Dysosmobacter sp.]|uniref:restriction endonuclease subunit S n=1 Tax=Dysosmobacter sp. TaxID=2591382 RepID=UPI00284CA22A
MTPQELKNSILQLAIQGRLVEQRPEEGTAQELYRQIQAEKQRLIQEGKIKKEKPLPEIAEDEKPFEIPESWMWVRLGTCILLLSGSDLVPSKYNNHTKGIPYITGASNIEKGNIIINRWTEFPSNIATQGCLLLTCKGTVGKTAILTEPYVHIARQIMALMPIIVDVRYLQLFVECQVELLKKKAKSMIPGIERNVVLNISFPLPPLAEQKRIVTKIEELLPLVDRYEAAWTRLEDFNRHFPEDMKKSILQQAIQGKLVEQRPEEGTAQELYQQIQAEKQRLIKEGKIRKEKPLPEITEDEKPFEIPESWMWVRLQQIGELSRGRSQKRPRNDPGLFTNGTFPFIQTGDVARANGHISHWTTMYNQEGVAQSRIWPAGTVCLTIAANIGDVAILDFDACFPDSVVGFNAYRPILSNEFFMYGLMCYKT